MFICAVYKFTYLLTYWGDVTMRAEGTCLWRWITVSECPVRGRSCCTRASSVVSGSRWCTTRRLAAWSGETCANWSPEECAAVPSGDPPTRTRPCCHSVSCRLTTSDRTATTGFAVLFVPTTSFNERNAFLVAFGVLQHLSHCNFRLLLRK